jgi:hypothetical protein
MSDSSHYNVTTEDAAIIEKAFMNSSLNALPWHQELPSLHIVQAQFQDAIKEHNLRQTALGSTLTELSERKTASGWLIIDGLPKTIHPHLNIGLCSYLIGEISEVPGAGAYISQVREQADAQSDRPSHANNLAFELHTDRSFLKEGRPEFQLLQSVYNPSGYGGLSEVANIDEAIAALEPNDAQKTIRLLSEENFLFPAPPHSNPQGGDMVQGAILDPMPSNRGQHFIRFRQDGLVSITKEAGNAVVSLVNVLNKVKKQFLLQDGQILVTDNWRALHGRTNILSNPTRPRELNKSYVDISPVA